ncbi:(2Fe-2S)-binding protein [Microvirga terricola]|uniref:Bacterioferritin-associated ferredoxin n=1 Tax=Microvirga terricola TaxID=2719797 RepID=A0ABX0VE16_9HYPH|nr:(2Fe-2S)-binding protein [Microvirga terricola]NIX78068.1 (2Fe-2S)-binding protein [Microvirga terricola]
MIVCSCNVLSDGDVKACLAPGPRCPRTPAQVYRCLGCSPNCGRCVRTIRTIMDQALAEAGAEPLGTCEGGCCPAIPQPAAAEPAL